MPQTIELSADFERDLSNWDLNKSREELQHRQKRLHLLFDDKEKAKRDFTNEETNEIERLDAECDRISETVAAASQRERLDEKQFRERIVDRDKLLLNFGRRLPDGSAVPLSRCEKKQKLFASFERVNGRLQLKIPEGFGEDGGFSQYHEQLLSVHQACSPGYYGNLKLDERLASLAPAGNQTGVDSDGGYLVQKDFSATIFKRMYELGEVLSRCNRVGVTGNGLRLPVVAETSRATGSRYGGIQVYRVGEGNSGTYTRPKLAMIELTLKKLMALYTCTDELLADAPAMAQLAQQAVSEEFTFKIENEIFRGTGAGEMLGFLNSPALVTVTEGDATTDQITSQNVRDMWARLWARSRPNAVWFINQDCEPSLMTLNSAVGTAGGDLVYLPPGGYSAAPYGTLFGRPVIPVEYCATVGDVADICLVDLSQYLMIEKGGMTSDSSIHVYFDSGQQAFRWTMRNDGQPTWHAPLTPFQGTNTLSPFVVAATRT